MTKAHLITVATALSLGYSAGFLTDNIASATTVQGALGDTAQGSLAQGNAAAVDIKTKASAFLCGKSETQKGLDAGDCSAANVGVVSVSYLDADCNQLDEVRVSTRFCYPVSQTLGDPQ